MIYFRKNRHEREELTPEDENGSTPPPLPVKENIKVILAKQSQFFLKLKQRHIYRLCLSIFVGQSNLACSRLTDGVILSRVRRSSFARHNFTLRYYERRLPHWEVVGKPLFVTFRLHGSLPLNRVFPPARLTSGKAFVAMDRILDRAENGPSFLRRPDVAGLVVAALRDGERRFQRYQLHAFVVMPNHVHVLVTPHVIATQWLGPLKGYTGYLANQLLGHAGKPFWQDESYDHLVRGDAEFERIRAYIEQNPVSAGLATTSERFRWSSAARTEAA